MMPMKQKKSRPVIKETELNHSNKTTPLVFKILAGQKIIKRKDELDPNNSLKSYEPFHRL